MLYVYLTIQNQAWAQVVLDDVDQVSPAVALRTPDFSKTIPEGRRELQEAECWTSPIFQGMSGSIKYEITSQQCHTSNLLILIYFVKCSKK